MHRHRALGAAHDGLLTTAQASPANMQRPATLRSALRLISSQVDRALLLNLGITLLLVGFSGALAAASPLALKHLIDAAAATAPTEIVDNAEGVLREGAMYLLVLFGGRLAVDVRPLVAGKIEQHVAAALRQRFLEHLLRLPTAYLVHRRSGEVQHSVDLATAGSQLIISHVANSLTPVLVELAGMAVILASLEQPALVIGFGVIAAMYLIVFSLSARWHSKHAREVSEASLDVHAQLGEAIGNVETLRCFSAGPQAEQALKDASMRLTFRWFRFHRLAGGTAIAATLIFALAMAGCLFVTTQAVATGTMTVGGFVLANVYLLQMIRPLEVLGCASRDLSRALGFMRPLLDMLAEPPEAATDRELAAPSPTWAAAPSIRLENVHFSYVAAQPVLQGLDVEFAAGRTTAIVSRSGAGKSSLIRLIERLYAPQGGRILLDGHPIDAIPAADLRAHIGLVAQECALLHTTAARNIALGLPGATREDVEEAARRAELHGVITALPSGYDTVLGERGQTLSGGERQRLAIARAVIRRPMIYLLDEPTSMLDSATEAAVMRTLRQVTSGCTTILVAHRLTTVMHADEIVVLDGGRLRERGRHDDLVGKGGLYAQLWHQQTACADD
ncbi:ABC transporter ATP-binding protein [Roseateles sp. DC23W]|uniref:ABC transporter ATP-binding protein n=1 Tax=Pelomonas dachongensis TaxID=3299029 RepID=A0ABW7EUL6_9BURK